MSWLLPARRGRMRTGYGGTRTVRSCEVTGSLAELLNVHFHPPAAGSWQGLRLGLQSPQGSHVQPEAMAVQSTAAASFPSLKANAQ